MTVKELVEALGASLRAEFAPVREQIDSHVNAPDPYADRLTNLEAERDAIKARLDAIEARFVGME